MNQQTISSPADISSPKNSRNTSFVAPKYRWAQFRKGCQLFECYLEEREAIAALNFVRFLS